MAWEVKGIDVSEHQRTMHWNTAIEKGISFAFARANIGSGIDDQFVRNAEKLTNKVANGVLDGFGFYYPYFPDIDWKMQTDIFIDLIADIPWNLPPVLDAELRGNWGYIDEAAELIELKLKVPPMMYGSPGVWDDEMGDVPLFAKYLLWVANYTSADQPRIPLCWLNQDETWTFWQWSADGNMKGAEYGAESGSIDLNRFNGSREQLLQLTAHVTALRAGTTPPPPPTHDHSALQTQIDDLEAKYQGILGITDALWLHNHGAPIRED